MIHQLRRGGHVVFSMDPVGVGVGVFCFFFCFFFVVVVGITALP